MLDFSKVIYRLFSVFLTFVFWKFSLSESYCSKEISSPVSISWFCSFGCNALVLFQELKSILRGAVTSYIINDVQILVISSVLNFWVDVVPKGT